MLIIFLFSSFISYNQEKKWTCNYRVMDEPNFKELSDGRNVQYHMYREEINFIELRSIK